MALQACAGRGYVHSARTETLRIAVGAEPATLNPVHVQIISESYFEEAIFDGLLKFNPSGRLLPDLATAVPSRANGGISSDLRTITYHLRRGVVWQDGAPFTSADVAFTYRLHADPRGLASDYSSYAQIAKLETPDAYTVRMSLKRPYVSALSELFVGAGGQIVPEHLLAHVTDLSHAAFNSMPIGTGPYRLAKWERGNEIELVANPHYFRGAPHIKTLRFRFVPSSTTRSLLLRQNEVDVANIGPSDVAPLKGVSSISILPARTPDVFFVAFNLESKPFDDPNVRLGLAYATDNRRLLKVLNGSGVPAETLLPPGTWAFDTKNGCPTFDLPRARALLGRTKEPVRLELAYVSSPRMEHLAVALQQQWKEAGVDVALRPRSLDALFGDQGILVKGTFQAAIDELNLSQPADLAGAVTSSNIPPQGFNAARYVNHSVDRWLSEAEATDNIRRRRALYAQVQRAMCRDVPIIPIYWNVRFYGVNRALRNFVPNNVTSDLWNAETWYLHE